jgi:hypothetical protein
LELLSRGVIVVPGFISTISNTAYQRANSHPLIEGSIIIHLAYRYSANGAQEVSTDRI